MRDEIDDRMWADHHQRFSQDLDRLLRRIGAMLARPRPLALRPPQQVR